MLYCRQNSTDLAIIQLKKVLSLNPKLVKGHQLLALSQGARTEKLKYGHRGANQPVIDLQSGRTYVTSQNHGYAVVGDSLDPSIGTVSHVNANDHTCEGIRYHKINAFTVQFHPEAHGGPLDTAYLFDEFLAGMEKEKM